MVLHHTVHLGAHGLISASHETDRSGSGGILYPSCQSDVGQCSCSSLFEDLSWLAGIGSVCIQLHSVFIAFFVRDKMCKMCLNMRYSVNLQLRSRLKVFSGYLRLI